MAEPREGDPPAQGPPPWPPWWSFLLVAALALPFCFLGLSGVDSDTFYHLAGGRWMHEHHRVLDHETFSFTIPGRPWTNYYWAFEWLLFEAHHAGGLAGVFVLRALIVLATFGLFLLLVHRRTGGARLETVTFGLLLLPVHMLRSVNVRPYLVSALFLVVLLLLAEAFRRGRAAAGLAAAILCVAWANLHGVEYPVALAALLVHAIDAVLPHLRGSPGQALRSLELRRWGGLLIACTLAFLVNPFGWRLLLTPRIGADAEVMAQISEMVPPPLWSFGQLFPVLDLASWVPVRLAALLGVAFLPWMLRTGRLRDAGLFVLGLALLLDKSRFVGEFLILALPPLAAAVAAARRRWPARAWPRYALLAAAAYVALSAGFTLRQKARAGAFEAVSQAAFPVGAVQFLDATGLAGDLHCDPTLAGYVTWRLYPRVRILMDMRTPEPFSAQEVWLAQALGDSVPVDSAEERWPIDLALFRRGVPLAMRYRANPGFAPVYADSEYVLFARVREGGGEPAPGRLTTLDFMEALETRPDLAAAPPPALRAEAERLAGAWPANDLAQRALLWLLLREGRAAEAQARAADLAARHPRRDTFPLFEGLALRQLGRQADAAVAFRRAAALAPEFLPAHVWLAETLLALGRPEEGLEVMERTARGRWTRLSAREYAILGRLRQVSGRWGPARNAFERALWLTTPDSPLRADLANDLGMVRLASGDAAGALAVLDEALTLRPEFPQALFNRARALRTLGRRDESDAVLDRLEAAPALPPSLREAVAAERLR